MKELERTMDYPETISYGSNISSESISLPVIDVKTLSEKILNARPEDAANILKDIAEVESDTERDSYVQALSKKLEVPKPIIKKELKALKPKTDEIQPEISANFPELIDLVMNENGEVAYLIKKDDELQVETLWDIDGKLYCPPEKIYLPFELAKSEAVIKWYELDNDKQLFEDVITYCFQSG